MLFFNGKVTVLAVEACVSDTKCKWRSSSCFGRWADSILLPKEEKVKMSGNDHVDYHKAFQLLHEQYGCKCMRTDSGGGLSNKLLENGLIDEIKCFIQKAIEKKAYLGGLKSNPISMYHLIPTPVFRPQK